MSPILRAEQLSPHSGVFLNSNTIMDAEVNQESEKVVLFLHVDIYDVNTAKREATVRIHVTLNDMYWEGSTLEVHVWSGIIGSGLSTHIQCHKISQYYGVFSGWSDDTVWLMEGTGEQFPFDIYYLNFTMFPRMWYDVEGETHSIAPEYTYGTILSGANFQGVNLRSLKDTWMTESVNLVPSVTLSPTNLLVKLERRSLVPFIEFVLPIILCYYLLGGTLLLTKKSDISVRLRVYLSLFLFAPMFFIAIQPFMPYRSTLSITEYLLTNLIVSSAIYSIFTMSGSLCKKTVFRRAIDVASASLSVVMFRHLYHTFTMETINGGPFMFLTFVQMGFVFGVLIALSIYFLRKILRFLRKKDAHRRSENGFVI